MMRKPIRHLASLPSLLVIVLVILTISLRYSSAMDVMKGRRIVQDRAEQRLEFKSISGERGRTGVGVPYSSHLYQSSDGIGISVTKEYYGTPIRASKALQRKLKKATKTVEQGYELDEEGRRVGTRVVATVAPVGGYKEQAWVLWTRGSDFYYIESPSMHHALEFEKKFYR